MMYRHFIWCAIHHTLTSDQKQHISQEYSSSIPFFFLFEFSKGYSSFLQKKKNLYQKIIFRPVYYYCY